MPRGTCWKGYVQKGFKKKGNRSVPNCVAVQNAYLGRAVKQPTETDTEFKIRHEYHTPFEEPQKGRTGKLFKSKSKKVSEENSNDMTDYPIGDGKDYPGNPDMPIIRSKPSFTIEEINTGGLLKQGKPKLALRGWK